MSHSTIFALSSGDLPSGVAVVRISGPGVVDVMKVMTGRVLPARSAELCRIIHPGTADLLDEGLVLFFEGPASFTGEDVLEIQCHGGIASVTAILAALGDIGGFEPAERGDFSRRAFENGKMDLTELEGLSDLVAAQTENQRRLALNQTGGSLRKLYDNWRFRLIKIRALIEAEFDFADEDDIPGSVSEQVWADVDSLRSELLVHLDDRNRGEITRDGFRIALLGPPNAGKSSLLNALAKREVAIVTPEAGTTRDVIEVSLDIDGQLVILSDTAGIREASNIVEIEGIRRSKETAERANLSLWLQPKDNPEDLPKGFDAICVSTKSDLERTTPPGAVLSLNTIEPAGLNELMEFLGDKIGDFKQSPEEPIVTRQRHRMFLRQTLTALEATLQNNTPLELRSENLRIAADALGRVTGRIDVEDLLDVIFSEFCIGK